MPEPELFEIGAAIIRYRWNKDDPYIYMICTQDELENYHNSIDELDYCSQEVINVYHDYMESFGVIAEKTFKFSEGIEKIIGVVTLAKPNDIIYRNNQ